MITGSTPLTWVIGAGGLLGGSLARTMRARPDALLMTTPVEWATRRTHLDLADGLTRLIELTSSAGGPDRPWRIAWCAGAGVTGTTEEALALEVSTLTGFLQQLASTRGLGRGTVFLASSAGGVYAGGPAGRPYDELDRPAPNSAYGHAKLAGERAAGEFARSTGHQVRIGRIANLYGPGQDLTKPQGLISHLCRQNLTRQPVSVYVPLDTIRDYLFVDDCAALIADLLDQPRGPGDTEPVVKILASQQGVTIGTLVAICRQVFKRAPRLVLGTSANATYQVRDLRFRSVVWPQLDRRQLTPLPAGIAATAAEMLRAAQTGTAARPIGRRSQT